MTLEDAKTALGDCQRDELRDHAFGDSEVSWFRDGKEIASGYFGRDSSVSFYEGDRALASFEEEDARQLRFCGRVGVRERNDSTGPDTYRGG